MVTQVVDVFRAVSDPTRREILDRLRGGRLPAGELARGFPVSRPAISRHLRILRGARLVVERRVGRERHYQLTPRPLRELDAWLESYRSELRASLGRLKRLVEEDP